MTKTPIRLADAGLSPRLSGSLPSDHHAKRVQPSFVGKSYRSRQLPDGGFWTSEAKLDGSLSCSKAA